MKWFKHDTDATADAKLRKLIIRHGPVGYAIYFHCLELIANSVGESKITFELEHDSEIIADNLKVQGTQNKSAIEVVQEIMHYAIELGLFDARDHRVYCFKLLKRLDTSMTSSPRMRKLIASAKESHDLVMTQSCDSHDPVMTQSCQSHDNVMQEVEVEVEVDKTRLEVEVEGAGCDRISHRDLLDQVTIDMRKKVMKIMSSYSDTRYDIEALKWVENRVKKKPMVDNELDFLRWMQRGQTDGKGTTGNSGSGGGKGRRKISDGTTSSKHVVDL